MEGGSKLKQFLCNVELNIGVEVLIKTGVLLLAEFTYFLRNDFLEFLGPFVVLDFVLCIN
jgi:hypothetical protein